MRIGITGPDGFIAWHTRCALRTRQDDDVVGIGEAEFDNPNLMDLALSQVDVVIHLAGLNRAPDEEAIALGNPWLASQLAAGLLRTGHPISVVNGNSIQSLGDSVFGISKRKAADILRSAADATGAHFTDVLLPNIFGEHGVPFYNSVVATFCSQLANGETPKVDLNREIPLLHAQRAASLLLDACGNAQSQELVPAGKLMRVSELLSVLEGIAEPYRDGQLPNLSDSFTRDLFNTYRSYTFPNSWPILPIKHADERGELVEAVRAGGGETQVFFSTTHPGYTRGGHYHLRKVERFLVVEGIATIKLRRLFTNQVVEFHVSGDVPAIVDMPTLWTHSITNTGDRNLITLFYADDEFNPENPDTYWVAV